MSFLPSPISIPSTYIFHGEAYEEEIDVYEASLVNLNSNFDVGYMNSFDIVRDAPPIGMLIDIFHGEVIVSTSDSRYRSK